MRLDFAKLTATIAAALEAAPVWIEAAALVTNWAAGVVRHINAARDAKGITDEAWSEAKRKNSITLSDLVRLRGGVPPGDPAPDPDPDPVFDPYFRELNHAEFNAIRERLESGDRVSAEGIESVLAVWIEKRAIGGPKVPKKFRYWYVVGGEDDPYT